MRIVLEKGVEVSIQPSGAVTVSHDSVCSATVMLSPAIVGKFMEEYQEGSTRIVVSGMKMVDGYFWFGHQGVVVSGVVKNIVGKEVAF